MRLNSKYGISQQMLLEENQKKEMTNCELIRLIIYDNKFHDQLFGFCILYRLTVVSQQT